MKSRLAVYAAGMATAVWSCGPTVTVRHEVEPIHVTVDVYVRVERELEEFFAFEEHYEQQELDNGNKEMEDRR